MREKRIALTELQKSGRGFELSLPKSLREAMHLQPGQQFELIQTGEIIQLVPKTSIRELRGRARGARGKVDPMSRTVFFRI